MVGSVSLVLKSSVWAPQGLSSECIYPNAAIFRLVPLSTVSALSTSDAVPSPYLQPQLLSRTSHLHFKWPVKYLQLGDSSHLKLNVSPKMNLPLSFPNWRRLSKLLCDVMTSMISCLLRLEVLKSAVTAHYFFFLFCLPLYSVIKSDQFFPTFTLSSFFSSHHLCL